MLDQPEPARAARDCPGEHIGGLAEILASRIDELDRLGNPTLAFQASGQDCAYGPDSTTTATDTTKTAPPVTPGGMTTEKTTEKTTETTKRSTTTTSDFTGAFERVATREEFIRLIRD